MLDFDECCRKTNFIVRFLRIHPVQSVANSPTQLSGRGCPRIFHMELFSSQLYVFLVLQNWSRAV